MRYHVYDGDEMREQQLSVDVGAVAGRPSDDWRFAVVADRRSFAAIPNL